MTDKIPKGWKKVKIKEIAAVVNGGTPSTKVSEYWNGDIPWLTPKDLTNHSKIYIKNGSRNISIKGLNNSSAKLLPRGTILLTSRAPIGYIAIAGKEIATNQGFKNFIVDSKSVYNLFFYYWLKNNINYLKHLGTGTTFAEINKTMIENLTIKIPESLDEQRAIASVLSSLDDKIDLLQRENKTLEDIAQTLFRKWFIEDAKEDWKEIPLKNIYVFEKGFEPGSKNYLEEKTKNAIRFIRVGDMLNSNANIYIDKKIALRTCKEDDLMVSFDGTVGRVVFGIEGAYSSGIRKVCSDNPVYNNLGLKYLIFTSKDIQDLIKSYATGTVILHASSSINHLTFAFPEENDIKKFNTIITPMFDKILKNKRQIRTLEQLRDTLLPKLMSGEVRVKV